MLYNCFLLFFHYAYLIPFACTEGRKEHHSEHRLYRVSMVSRSDNPSKPAIFSHAESPVWDAAQNSLFFVDVHKQNVHRLDYASGIIYTQHIGYGQVNVVSLVANSKRLLVAVRSSLYLMDWGVQGDHGLRLIATVDQGLPDNVINEGKPDAAGRFWAGTKGPQTYDKVMPDKAVFFSIEQNEAPKVHLKPISISNGLVWALNNSVLYYIDSPTGKVEAFDFDLERGEICCRRTIIDTKKLNENAIPDGMTIDNMGHLWIALMFGGSVIHVDPDTRKVVYAYKLPVSRVTSVTWGGPNLEELFVTTGQDPIDSASEPLGGAIFTLRNTGSAGVQPYTYRFDNADSY